MLKFKFYDKEARIEKCWYDSSNILYSECFDYENDYKDLNVVFKEGRTYLYKKIDVKDYMAFRNATSQGAALSKFITKKDNGQPIYECLRLSDKNLGELEEERRNLLKESNVKVPNTREVLTFEIDSNSNSLTIYNENNEEVYKTEEESVGRPEAKMIFDILDLLEVNYNKRYI